MHMAGWLSHAGSSKHLNNSLNNNFTTLRLVLILTIPLFFPLYTSRDQDKEALHLLLVIFFCRRNLAALSLLLPKLNCHPPLLNCHQQEVQLCRDSQKYAVYVPMVAHVVAHTLTIDTTCGRLAITLACINHVQIVMIMQ